MILTTLITLSFLSAILTRPIAARLGRLNGWGSAVIPVGLFAAFFSLVDKVARGTVIAESVPWVPSVGINFALKLDGFSLMFVLLITGIGALVVIYSGAYFSDQPPEVGARFIALIILFMSAMLGTVLADDLITLFVFWEMTSLTSFMLIGFESEKSQARTSALQSLLVTGLGGLALLGAFIFIGIALGTFSFSEVILRSSDLASSPYLPAILPLLLIGAFTKSAQFPFHFWLPNAMQAPTPASAYLHSATMVKLGVYLLARFDVAFTEVPAFGIALVVIGSMTMIVGAFEAIRATGFKAVLAYTTVASLGILVMLIGLDGTVAIVATVGFILTHACYKAALFFVAGNAIHATGVPYLRHINGLGKALPFTAAAAVLASMSMAGLPPSAGFIAKEYLFEAQLVSSWKLTPIGIAVMVNAVMVGVAGVVVLKPFILNRHDPTPVHHGETKGLLIGPIVLAIAGIMIGMAPSLFVAPIIQPAAAALYGAPIHVAFSLWHGLTPMLALSALVVAIGSLIALNWDGIHDLFQRKERIHRWLGDAVYFSALNNTLNFARSCTRWLQNGDQRHYTSIILGAVIFLVAYGVLRSDSALIIDLGGAPLRLSPIIILMFAMAGAIAAVQMSSLIAAVIAVGIIGFSSAILYLLNGAPDLALTQFGVETLFVVVVMAVLLRIPVYAPSTRTRKEKRRDIVLSVGVGMVIFLALATTVATPLDTTLSDFYANHSLSDAFGRNVVNVLLVDFRAMDTMGEISVIAFAAIAVWGLLRRKTSSIDPGHDPEEDMYTRWRRR